MQQSEVEVFIPFYAKLPPVHVVHAEGVVLVGVGESLGDLLGLLVEVAAAGPVTLRLLEAPHLYATAHHAQVVVRTHLALLLRDAVAQLHQLSCQDASFDLQLEVLLVLLPRHFLLVGVDASVYVPHTVLVKLVESE
jgi:hypothetical protein